MVTGKGSGPAPSYRRNRWKLTSSRVTIAEQLDVTRACSRNLMTSSGVIRSRADRINTNVEFETSAHLPTKKIVKRKSGQADVTHKTGEKVQMA